MMRSLPLFALLLATGCTPREQAGVVQDSIAVTTTTTSSSTTTQVDNGVVVDSVRKGTAVVPQEPKQPTSTTSTNPDKKMMRKTITAVLESNTHMWMEIPGVNGTGEGRDPNGNPAIIIFTDRDASEIQSKLPSEKDGYPIIIREIGVVKPLGVED
jgi:hypothetical protein